MGLRLGPGVRGSYQNNDDDGNSNTATIYCLGDGLRVFLQSQDPFALPLGWPHPAVGQRAALWNLGLLWLLGGDRAAGPRGRSH